MPVSPADFEFYSRMTGQPIPNTPAGRMAIAPQVYNMRRGGGGFGRFLRGAAKGALAAGALAGAGALALATQEEMAKTGGEKKAKVTENLTDTGVSTETTPGGQKVTVNATDRERQSPIRERIDAFQRGVTGGSQVLTGDALDAAEAAVFDDPNVLIGGGPLQNRISGQTQVPQADPNTAFESRGAQIASTSEPTQPRVEVRQQPSSGVQVTDLSNVAATEGGMPAKETNPELSEIRQQVEMYEGSPFQSPFQAGGAMEELRRQSMDVKALKQRVTDLGVPKSIRDDVAVFLTGATGGQAGPQPFTQKQANTRIVDLMKEGIEHLEGGKPSIQFPEGQGSKYESMTLDPSGDINVKFRNYDKTYSYPQTPEGSEAFAQLADMYNNPGPATASPFVTDKGREVGAVLSQAQEKKAAAPTLKEIAGDALNLLNPFKGKKIDPREQQVRSEVDRSLATFTPEQKEAEVRRRLGQ
jgi:hypothetical protein